MWLVLQSGLPGVIRVRERRCIDMDHHLAPLARDAWIELVMEGRLREQGQRVRLLVGHGRDGRPQTLQSAVSRGYDWPPWPRSDSIRASRNRASSARAGAARPRGRGWWATSATTLPGASTTAWPSARPSPIRWGSSPTCPNGQSATGASGRAQGSELGLQERGLSQVAEEVVDPIERDRTRRGDLYSDRPAIGREIDDQQAVGRWLGRALRSPVTRDR